jgi:hypothetical protein
VLAYTNQYKSDAKDSVLLSPTYKLTKPTLNTTATPVIRQEFAKPMTKQGQKNASAPTPSVLD